ncbi:hypothetical protein EX30DRAFT_323669 [Ascodesmis nigricans]|uniref:Endonuclease n=1 Tax=Ascodesmis nigricans TaxID=341454 RepID=A0A4S2MK77_9PEZI|nr:hypothetical protein EX30DRAFT_323669 [Ascodesmis nigricans]
MSKFTALIAAASAATGAACTAFFFSTRSQPAPVTAAAPASAPVLSGSGSAAVKQALQSPVNPAGLFQYGFPGPVNDLATRQALVSSFDRRTRNPIWVAEHITAASLKMHGGDRKHSQFLEDDAIPEKFRGKLKDYFRSGYDRGHQVPAADAKFSQDAMNDTFYLSNMCPQVGDGFNRDYWAHFEDFSRRLTQKYTSVRIITGPLYLPRLHPDGKYRVSYEVIGNPPNIAVPTHFYKVIIGEGQLDAQGNAVGPVAVGAFVMPNAVIDNKTPLTEFVAPLEIVERAAGVEFMPLLKAERKKELCREVKCEIHVREFAKQVKGQQPVQKR